MKRRKFIEKAGCGAAAMMAAGMPMVSGQEPPPQPPRRRYAIEIEIYEVGAKTTCFKKGDKFKYPDDCGQICSWLMDSMKSAIMILQYGGTIPWLYKDTPYEKVIDPDGVTTEFIRCPDPTESGVVAKIIRTKLD